MIPALCSLWKINVTKWTRGECFEWMTLGTCTWCQVQHMLPVRSHIRNILLWEYEQNNMYNWHPTEVCNHKSFSILHACIGLHLLILWTECHWNISLTHYLPTIHIWECFTKKPVIFAASTGADNTMVTAVLSFYHKPPLSQNFHVIQYSHSLTLIALYSGPVNIQSFKLNCGVVQCDAINTSKCSNGNGNESQFLAFYVSEMYWDSLHTVCLYES